MEAQEQLRRLLQNIQELHADINEAKAVNALLRAKSQIETEEIHVSINQVRPSLHPVLPP